MISLIAAVARHGVIGKDNKLLWHVPEDMRHFRETTRGKPVIMGRRTWESLPDSFRPLPGRLNIVVSRNPDYGAEGATLTGSLGDAIARAGQAPEVFVIGGAELYREALPIAQKLYITEVQANFPGDAFFPEISPAEWRETRRTALSSKSGLELAFVDYLRR